MYIQSYFYNYIHFWMKLTNYIKKQYCFLKKKKIIILAFTVRIISIVSCFLSQEGNVEDRARNPFRTNEIIFIDYDYYRVRWNCAEEDSDDSECIDQCTYSRDPSMVIERTFAIVRFLFVCLCVCVYIYVCVCNII